MQRIMAMRTYKYKIQRHKRNRHIQGDLKILAHVWNHFIALTRRHYRIYGQCEGYKRPSWYRLKRHLTKLKKLQRFQHWKIPYSWSLQEILKRIEFGYQKFLKRDAKRPPKFKKHTKYASQTFDGKQCPFKAHVTIDNQGGCPIARVRINRRWYNFWYSREIQGNVKQVTVKKDGVGDFYVTFTTDNVGLELESKTGNAAGFDMGIKTLLTCSDGTKYESPQFYRNGAKKVKQANRNLSRKVRDSHNREKARLSLARTHRKIERQRMDHHWKLALELVRHFDWLFFEDLNLDSMKRLWGRKVSDIAFGELLQKIKWQATKRMKQVGIINKWQPTTSVCHVCSEKVNLQLRDREWTCHNCTTHHDRDTNAAINVLKVGASTYGVEDVRLPSGSVL